MKKDLTYLIVIAALAVVIYILFTRNQINAGNLHRATTIIQEQQAEISYRKDNEGRIIADKVAAEATAKQLAESYPSLANTLIKDFDIKLKNLRTVIQAEIRASGNGTGIIVRDTIYRDSVIANVVDSIFASDQYLRFKGQVSKEGFAWNYTYSDSLIFATHVKKKWIFGNEQLFVSGRLSNPSAKFTKQTAIRMENYRDKRFSVMAGALYDPFNNRVSVGVGIGFSLWKF